MAETASLMRNFISGVKPGTLFTTRECLPLGNRAAIDQALCRLVKRNVLVRLARGVFTRSSTEPKPSLQEIVELKAKSFGRRIATHGSMLAYNLGLTKQKLPNDKVVFATDSSSSKFRCGDITVYFKKTCWRKMSLQKSKAGKKKLALQESKVGEALVALWHLGKHGCYPQQIGKVIAGLGRHKVLLRESAPWIPAWLSAYFLHIPLNHLNRQLVTV